MISDSLIRTTGPVAKGDRHYCCIVLCRLPASIFLRLQRRQGESITGGKESEYLMIRHWNKCGENIWTSSRLVCNLISYLDVTRTATFVVTIGSNLFQIMKGRRLLSLTKSVYFGIHVSISCATDFYSKMKKSWFYEIVCPCFYRTLRWVTIIVQVQNFVTVFHHLKNKTNHPMAGNSHPTAAANKSRHLFERGGGTKLKETS